MQHLKRCHTKVHPSYDPSCAIFSSLNFMVIFNITSADYQNWRLRLESWLGRTLGGSLESTQKVVETRWNFWPLMLKTTKTFYSHLTRHLVLLIHPPNLANFSLLSEVTLIKLYTKQGRRRNSAALRRRATRNWMVTELRDFSVSIKVLAPPYRRQQARVPAYGAVLQWKTGGRGDIGSSCHLPAGRHFSGYYWKGRWKVWKSGGAIRN